LRWLKVKASRALWDAPANGLDFDEIPRALVPKALMGAPAKVWQQVRAYMILAQQLHERVGLGIDVREEFLKAGCARGHPKPLGTMFELRCRWRTLLVGEGPVN
jgi:hypothetical protein